MNGRLQARDEPPSGLAIAAFSLSIPAIILVGVGVVSLGLAIAALIRDRTSPRKQWAGWWAFGLSLFAIGGYLMVIVDGAGVA